MMYYCLNCNEFHEAEIATYCPHCGAVGDDLVECDDLYDGIEDEEWEPTDDDLEAMYEDYEARRIAENMGALIGVQ